jgi:hypothetical protein
VNGLSFLKAKERTMTVPTTDDAFAIYLRDLRARLLSRPPRGGGRHKTFEDLMQEQGVGPINLAELKELNPGPFYEGFEEDITRMRNGLPPLGPIE